MDRPNRDALRVDLTAALLEGERQQSDAFFKATQQLLDRDAPGWRAH